MTTARQFVGAHHRQLLRWTVLLATLVAAGLFLAPKASEALNAAHSLGDVGVGWIIVALVAQGISLFAFSVVTYSLLPADRRPRFLRVLRLDLVTIALSHAIPAGSAAGSALGYGFLAEEGVEHVAAGLAKVVQTVLAAITLQVLLWVAIGLNTIGHAPTAGHLAASSAGAAILLLMIGFGYLVVHHEQRAARIAARLLGWVPGLDAGRAGEFMIDFAHRARELATQPRTLFWIAGWSMANWVFDLICLWASLRAFGGAGNPVELTIAFCIAQVIGSIPISPAGLGLVEGSLVPLLTGFAVSANVAVLGVLLWRLFNFWLPLPVGLVAYAGIAADRRCGILPRRTPLGSRRRPVHAGAMRSEPARSRSMPAEVGLVLPGVTTERGRGGSSGRRSAGPVEVSGDSGGRAGRIHSIHRVDR
jgi:uncharacterized protein (TIRG00374 family)